MKLTKCLLCLVGLLALIPVPVLAGPQVGTPAPDFSLPDTALSYHRLSDYRGQVVMLNFWQSG